MDIVEDSVELVLPRVDVSAIVAAARKKTRVGEDLIDDRDVLERLRVDLVSYERRTGAPLAGVGDEALAGIVANAALRVLRECLVTTLVADYDLRSVAADSCAAAGARGREEQVAYCLVVLCQKADPVRPFKGAPPQRRYRLDVGAEDFAARLRHWADVVAGNLRDWGDVYETIRAEAERGVTTTLCELVTMDRRADVVTMLASAISDVVLEGERLADMNLERARALTPRGREYVFSSLLPQWAAVIASRKVGHQVASLSGLEEVVAEGDGDDETPLDRRDELAADSATEFRRAIARQIAALQGTRGVLQAAIERATDLEARMAQLRVDNPAHDVLITRLRAALVHVADGLGEEQRALGAMLAYLLLAMPHGKRRQRVAILSLRDEMLEADLVEHIAARMRAVVAADDPPSPSLIVKAAAAKVPNARHMQLERLRDDRRHRERSFVVLRRLLDELPASVAGIAGIATAIPGRISATNVTSTRGQAASELKAVDRRFGKVFRRYAIGIVA